MNADGSGLTNLTQSRENDFFASWAMNGAWSPDGSKLAFVSKRDGNEEVYIMDADGSRQTNLTNHAARDWGAAWSPDGSQLAFVTDRDGNFEIYLVDVASGLLTRLTDSPGSDQEPIWLTDD